jgi:hypothetical protein
MIVVELSGGMGNQMFQYAFGRYLAHKHNTKLFLDTHYLLDRSPNRTFIPRNYDLSIFNIEENIASEKISSEYGTLRSKLTKAKQKIFKPKELEIITETSMQVLEDIDKISDNVYLKGYWQNNKYFDEVLDTIKQDFSFSKDLSKNCENLMSDIQNSNSVCLNVRRVDFVTNSSHGALKSSYYKNAEEVIKNKVENPVFFIFSDDIEWCKENIKPNYRTVYVEHSFAGEKFKDYLELMLNCKHFIIPNSSFAWWAVRLSPNNNKVVVAPEFWLHNPIIKTKEVFNYNWQIVIND